MWRPLVLRHLFPDKLKAPVEAAVQGRWRPLVAQVVRVDDVNLRASDLRMTGSEGYASVEGEYNGRTCLQ